MLESIRQPLEQAGVKIDKKTDHRDQYQGVEISLENGIISPVDVETGPYPNFPTDMLPQWVVFMAMATSTSSRSKRSAIIRDKIYNNRLKYVNYVKAIMGASIELQQDDKECCVYAGNKKLHILDWEKFDYRLLVWEIFCCLGSKF